MRTTLTLEPDVAAKLKELAWRKHISFKEAVDTILRRGLAAAQGGRPGPRLRVRTFRSGLRPGIDPTKLNQISDDLEVRETVSR